jgi:PKD repeat protein
MRRYYIALVCLFFFAACKKNDGLPPASKAENMQESTVDFKLAYRDSGWVVLTNVSENTGWPLVNWGDGTESENIFSDSVVHRYRASDTYTITLTVKDRNGKEFKKTENAEVKVPFYNDFNLEYVEPDAVRLTNLSVGAAHVLVNWGDSSPDEDIIDDVTTHYYTTNSTYAVALTIEDANGKKIEKSKTIKVNVIAQNHAYTAVFPDDANNAHYLYFAGFRRSQTPQLVWKYDLDGDSLLAGYPKPVTEEFNLPYPELQAIGAVLWLQDGAYVSGGGYFCSYNFSTKEAGSLLKINDAVPYWPSAFPPALETGFYASNGATYLFAGGSYIKMTGTTILSGYPRPTNGSSGWPGLDAWDLNSRPLSGGYYRASDGIVPFFSRDEMIEYNFSTDKGKGPFKIKDIYHGL